jgi:mRNA-degrading endonuclease toxin of MazEF toxin-antitoxin module
MSPDYRNKLANDVLVIPLTTNLRTMPTHVRLPAGVAGLREPSMAKAEQITALPKEFFVRGPLGGRLPVALVRELRRAVWRAMGGEAIPEAAG